MRHHRFEMESAEYDLEIWTPRLLATRRLEGASLEELLVEAADDAALDPVVLYYADLAIKRHDTGRAIGYLEAARDHHGARGHHRRDVRRRLAELYEAKDIEAARGELMWLVADARGKYADEIAGLWLRVKESYGDEWEQVRTRLLDDLETKTTLACIRAEERWDDLMDAIERLDLYRDQLLEHCPDRLIAAYVSDLRERAKLKRSSRQLYRDFVDRARTVRDLPGGREVVRPLVAGMRERYQSRPALLEELDRL